ncbi:hypothetical protein GCM10010344_62340 [Streptomyces bluensis]|nr:hypothetical protein GCM10010344_62340 [Streptomyces bluensis]
MGWIPVITDMNAPFNATKRKADIGHIGFVVYDDFHEAKSASSPPQSEDCEDCVGSVILMALLRTPGEPRAPYPGGRAR